MKIRLHILPILLLLLALMPHAIEAAPIARAATPTPEPTEAFSPEDIQARITSITQEDPTFADDFSRSDGKWSTKSDDKDVTYSYKDRAFHMRLGKDNFTTWRTNTDVNDLKLTNFYLELTVNQVSGPADGEFGVVFREVNTDNFYLFTIQQGGSYSLWKHVGQDWETLIDWTKSSAIQTRAKATNKLGVLVEEDNISLLANDKVLTQIKDDSFAQGIIGLAAGTQKQAGLEVAFDNVKLWSLYAEPTDLEAHVQDIMSADPAFSDDFQSDSGDWSTKSDEKDVKFSYTNNAFHIRIDRTKWTAWTFNKQIDALKLGDFYVEAEASQVAGPTGAEFGLIFRQVDNDNFYLYSISREGTYSFWKQIDGKWQPIIDWTNADAIEKGAKAVNKLAVLAEGPQFTLFANDQVLFQIKDNALASGSIGVMAGTYDEKGVDVAFSKLNIWSLQSTATDETATPEVTTTAEVTTTVDAEAVQTRIDEIKQGDPAFSNNFRQDSQDWTTDSTDKDVTFTYTNRALHIRVDREKWITWTTNKQIDELKLTDFYLETEVALQDAAGDSQFGVIFRVVDEQNFYKFAISHTGEYSLYKSVDNEWKPIIEWVKSDAVSTGKRAKNILGLLAEGAQLTLLVNDQVLAQVTDDSFSEGTIGLMAGAYDTPGVEVAFSKLDIWPISATEATTPEATETAEATEEMTPEATETPEVTETAEETATEEVTPEETETPEATETTDETTDETATPEESNPNAEAIPLKSLADQEFTSYKLRLEMKLDGQSGDQPMQGNLIIETTKNLAKNQSIVVIDGALVKSAMSKELNLPGVEVNKMTLFNTGKDVLVLINGSVTMCVKAAPDDQRLSGLSKVAELGDLLDSLAGEDSKMRGELVGEETANNIQTQHYTLDVSSLNKSNASETDRVNSGEIWVAVDGQYPVRLLAEGPTTLSGFLGDNDFTGQVDLAFDVSNVNARVNLQLPAACQKPVALP